MKTKLVQVMDKKNDSIYFNTGNIMKKIMFFMALLTSTSVHPMKSLNKAFKKLKFSSKTFKVQSDFSEFFQLKYNKNLMRKFCTKKINNENIKSFDSEVLLTKEKFGVVVDDYENQKLVSLENWVRIFGDEKIKNEEIPYLDKDLNTQDNVNKFYAILFQEPVTKERINGFVSNYGDYHNQHFIGLIFDLIIQSKSSDARECFLDVLSIFINACRSKNQISDEKIVKRVFRIISKIALFRQEKWPLENLEKILREMLKPN